MGTNQKKKLRFIKQLIILLLIITGISGALYSYVRWYNDSSLVCGHFISEQTKSESPKLCFEIAETEGKRAKGLMFRKADELEENAGMLFIYPEEGMRAFWMKNTFIPLDMIFMDSGKNIVGIIDSAAPLTESPRKVDKPSQYILELKGGSAKKWGISVGSSLQVEGNLPAAQE